MEPGERMLIPCTGHGPSISRLVTFPPPLEIELDHDGGVYVLEDDGEPEAWTYLFVPHDRR